MNPHCTGLVIIVSCLSHALAQDVSRVSVGSTGLQGNAPSVRASMSGDGRFVVFQTAAIDLFAGDTNDQDDVVVRDRQSGTTELVTRNSQGQQANFGGDSGEISGDGRFVAFASWSDNLSPNDTNGWMDVFVRDRLLSTTECVSFDVSGFTANRISRGPAISGDGRFVAFESRATNLVSAADLNGFLDDVFVRDRLSGATEIVSVDSAGLQGNSLSRAASISADGRYVAFESAADNLVQNDTNGTTDVFVHDRQTGTTVRASVSSAGIEGDLASERPFISGNGRFVAFESIATNFAPTDTNGNYDIYVRDLVLGVTLHGSVDSNGAGGPGDSFEPRLTPDGRFLAFGSYAVLDPVDTNADEDVFVRDFRTGRTQRISVTRTGGQIDTRSIFPALSADGLTAAFTTVGPDVVPGDTNEADDVFVNTWATDWTPVCLGDGSGLACPCGNFSNPGASSGCAHSFATGGRLSASGTASITNDTLVLRGTTMPDGPVLWFQGTTVFGAGLGTPFGDGILCAGGVVVRLGVKFNVAGVSSYPETADVRIAIAGSCTAGAARAYQGWFRDSQAFCTGAGFNLTNGVVLTWGP